MKIKKFTASSLKEGKEMIYNELGDDAIILSSRSAKSGSGNDMIEIVAAIDEKPTPTPVQPTRLSARKRSLPSGTMGAAIESNEEFLYSSSQFFDEINALKNMISELSEDVRYKYGAALGPVNEEIFRHLMKADVSEELALKIVGKLSSRGANKDLRHALTEARNILVEKIKILPPVSISEKTSIAAFVGPTGGGKTFSLIKLALICKWILKADVSILTTDTQKVGGADQLQTFASLASIPFQAVYDPEETSEAIDREGKRDFIFIDTVGRNPKNKDEINEIEKYLSVSNVDITYLTLSALYSGPSILQAVKGFSPLRPNALILTKIDEAASFGGLIGALEKSNLPLAYYTTGQQVPDDIEPADVQKLAELALPDIT